jgi:hypothetical protein
MVPNYPDDGGETDNSTPSARAEAEADRVRGVLRDDGVQDPVVMIGGTGEDRGNPRVFVWLDDMNVTAEDLIDNWGYKPRQVLGSRVALMRTFTHTADA